MKSGKSTIIFLVIGIILCLGLGTVGYLLSTNDTKEPDDTKNYEIKLIYYLDNEVSETIPTNAEGESVYTYDSYQCTNKVTGTWSEEKWEFVPNKTSNATCKIYFTSAKYEVKLNIENGTLNEEQQTLIGKGQDGVFILTPTENYTYASTTCETNNEIFWDEAKSELTVKNIQEETNCAVKFKLREYTVEIDVNNGSGLATKTIEHGKKLTSKVTPSSGYGDPTITCTNEQIATWTNNTLTINTVTNNTACTVAFKTVQTTPTEYTVTFQRADNDALIGTKKVLSGETAEIFVDIEGYNPSDVDCSTNKEVKANGIVRVMNVTRNMTCKVTLVAE